LTAVRPPIFPPSRPSETPQRPDAARLAAQKAFFDAALGKAAPAAPTTPTATVSKAATAPPRIPDADAEKPQKILRPGSLLDIRI
jgi:hypothetical protein